MRCNLHDSCSETGPDFRPRYKESVVGLSFLTVAMITKTCLHGPMCLRWLAYKTVHSEGWDPTTPPLDKISRRSKAHQTSPEPAWPILLL